MCKQTDARSRQVRRQNSLLESPMLEIMQLARTAAARQSIRADQIQRIGTYAILFGRHLGLNPDELVALKWGAIAQDIGMIGVSEAILHKRMPLKSAERRQFERHTIIGEHSVQPLRMAPLIAPIIRSHHERWDGRGYPDELAGTAIPLGARVVALLNAFVNLTTPRPDGSVPDMPAVLTHLWAGADSRWDPALVDLLTYLLVDASTSEQCLKMKAVKDSCGDI